MSNHRLQSRFKIIPQEQEQLLQMVNSRLRLEHQYLLTISNYRIAENEGTLESMMCEQFQEVVLFFQQFDYYLSELEKVYPLRQDELEQIIFSVTEALVYLEKAPFKNRHGDISARMICKTQKKWKLIDNCFIKGGLTAYEKALEHDQSFISPAQMNLIRHGLFRESPPLSEGDDVFALGMTCLEIMTGRPSKNCYREHYIRFNEEYMQ